MEWCSYTLGERIFLFLFLTAACGMMLIMVRDLIRFFWLIVHFDSCWDFHEYLDSLKDKLSCLFFGKHDKRRLTLKDTNDVYYICIKCGKAWDENGNKV